MKNTLQEIIQQKGYFYSLLIQFNNENIPYFDVRKEKIQSVTKGCLYTVVTSKNDRLIAFPNLHLNNTTSTQTANPLNLAIIWIFATNKLDLIKELNKQLKLIKQNVTIQNVKTLKQQIHNIIKNIQNI